LGLPGLTLHLCGMSRKICAYNARKSQMPQLHLFFPVEVAETAKARAKAAGKSLSSYLADLVVNEVAGEWPEGFFEEVVGGWKGEPLVRPKQGRAERRDRL
jgi:hypothetical protein